MLQKNNISFKTIKKNKKLGQFLEEEEEEDTKE